MNGHNTRILCDSGAFCCCISSCFYNRIKTKPRIISSDIPYDLKAANNVPLDVLGSVELDVELGGIFIPVQFYVVRNLSQNCILGANFFEESKAKIDYYNKTLSVYEDTVTVPLLNDIQIDKILRTTTKLRIPPMSETIFNAKMNTNEQITGITEALPLTVKRGLHVANVLLDNSNANMTCRILNSTRKTVYLPANFAFAYLSPVDEATGLNMIDVDAIAESDDAACDAQCETIDETDMPDHASRLAYLQSKGIKIGQDILNTDELQKLTSLLYSYRDIFATENHEVPKADIEPHKIILTDNKVVNERRFRYNPTQELKLEQRCDELLKAGILRESTSLFNSPVFLINQKGDKPTRFLVDFRKVNAKIEPLYCSLPSLEDVLDKISEEKPTIYSCMDIKGAFFGVPLEENSCQFTAFSTKNRHLEFTRLPQGYRNAPTVFTYALSKIFSQELRTNLLIYVDDMICFHQSTAAHIEFLESIFRKFRKFKLRLHPAKLSLAMSSVSFLGYQIGPNGYTTDTSRTAIIKNYPTPRNQRDVKRFLGLSAYYRRMICNYSKRAEPLRRLLAKDAIFTWTEIQEHAFQDLKEALCNPPILGFPDRSKPMRLTLDGCMTGLGYILSNLNPDGTETVLHFGARATTKAERSYSASDLELAALLTGIRTFNSYLSNTHFEVLTDHLSLTFIKNLKFGTSRLVRASIILSQYDFTIRHLAGKNNGAADAISRIPDIKADNLTIHEQQRCSRSDDDLLCVDATSNDAVLNIQHFDQCAESEQKSTHNEAYKPLCTVHNFLECTLFNCTCFNCLSVTDDVSCVMDSSVCETALIRNTTNVTQRFNVDSERECDVMKSPSPVESNAVDMSETEINRKMIFGQTQTENAFIHRRRTKTNNTMNKTQTVNAQPLYLTDTDNDDDRYFCNDLLKQNQPDFVTAVTTRSQRNQRDKTSCLHDNETGTTTGSAHPVQLEVQPAPSPPDTTDTDITAPAGRPDTAAARANDLTADQAMNRATTTPPCATVSDSDTAVNSSSITLALQSQDPEFGHLINYLLHNTLPADDKTARRTLLLSDYYVIQDGKLFHLTCSRRKTTKLQESLMRQLCIPNQMRDDILHQFHTQLLHPGSERQYMTMRCRVYWSNMYNDIRQYVSNCETCHRIKPNNHAHKAKIQTRSIPKTPFHTIHIDHLRLSVPNATHPYNYVLIVIDQLTLQVELIPTKSTSAIETANALYENWFCRYGVPSVLISDRHTAFTAAVTQRLLSLCGVKHTLISTKNPKSNGLCEQVNNRVINAIKVHCTTNGDWPSLLPSIAASYRASVSPTRQFSPYFLMYGMDMRLPIDSDCSSYLPAHERTDTDPEIFRDRMKILREQVQAFAENRRQTATTVRNKSRTASEYHVGQKVYLLNENIKPNEFVKARVRFMGPYVIVSKTKHNTYKLRHIYTGKTVKSHVHFDKLKLSSERRKQKVITRLCEEEEHDETRPSARGPADIRDTFTDATACRSNTVADDTTNDDDDDAVQANADTATVRQTRCQLDTEMTGDKTNSTSLKQNDMNSITTALLHDFNSAVASDDCTYINDSESAQNSQETTVPLIIANIRNIKRRLHKRADEMHKILKITRYNGFSRCKVLMYDGTTTTCRLLKVPTHLLCTFYLRKNQLKRK